MTVDKGDAHTNSLRGWVRKLFYGPPAHLASFMWVSHTLQSQKTSPSVDRLPTKLASVSDRTSALLPLLADLEGQSSQRSAPARSPPGPTQRWRHAGASMRVTTRIAPVRRMEKLSSRTAVMESPRTIARRLRTRQTDLLSRKSALCSLTVLLLLLCTEQTMLLVLIRGCNTRAGHRWATQLPSSCNLHAR